MTSVAILSTFYGADLGVQPALISGGGVAMQNALAHHPIDDGHGLPAGLFRRCFVFALHRFECLLDGAADLRASAEVARAVCDRPGAPATGMKMHHRPAGPTALTKKGKRRIVARFSRATRNIQESLRGQYGTSKETGTPGGHTPRAQLVSHHLDRRYRSPELIYAAIEVASANPAWAKG